MFRKLFRLMGKILKPVQGLIARVITGASVNAMKREGKERFLGYITNEYEDKAFKKILEVLISVFDAIEKLIKVLPDMFEPPVIKLLHELEIICVKNLELFEGRVELIAEDNKISDSEIDGALKFISIEFTKDISVWYAEAKELFRLEDSEVENPVSEIKFKYIAELKKKHNLLTDD